jgi:hypothetical protein
MTDSTQQRRRRRMIVTSEPGRVRPPAGVAAWSPTVGLARPGPEGPGRAVTGTCPAGLRAVPQSLGRDRDGPTVTVRHNRVGTGPLRHRTEARDRHGPSHRVTVAVPQPG